MSHNVWIVKASGGKELFDEVKLRTSLERTFATPAEINQIIVHITDELEDGMTTDHIYRHAFSLLKEMKNPQAIRRYSLRRALIDLGPTGFPFEKFLGEIFRSRGYEIANNQMVQGT